MNTPTKGNPQNPLIQEIEPKFTLQGAAQQDARMRELENILEVQREKIESLEAKLEQTDFQNEDLRKRYNSSLEMLKRVKKSTINDNPNESNETNNTNMPPLEHTETEPGKTKAFEDFEPTTGIRRRDAGIRYEPSYHMGYVPQAPSLTAPMQKLVTKVREFSGKPQEDVDTWIFQMENAFDMARCDESEKTAHAIGNLQGLALMAIRSFIKHRREQHKTVNWDSICVELRLLYRPTNYYRNLILRWQELKQTGSLQEYINKFQHYDCLLAETDKETKVVQFIKNLKPELRDKVFCQAPLDINQAYHMATSLDINQFNGTTSSSAENVLFAGRKHKNDNKNKNKNNHNEKQKGGNNQQQQQKNKSDKPYCHFHKRTGHHTNECRAKQNASQPNGNSNPSQQTTNSNSNSERNNNNNKKANVVVKKVLSIENEYNDKAPITLGYVEGVKVRIAIDSGAEMCVISRQLARNLELDCEQTGEDVQTARGPEVNVERTAPLSVVVAHSVSKFCFTVLDIPNDVDVLLGTPWLNKMRVLCDTFNRTLIFTERVIPLDQIDEENSDMVLSTFNTNNEDPEYDLLDDISDFKIVFNIDHNVDPKTRESALKILEENKNLFASSIDNLGCCTVGEHVIDTGDHKPIFVPPYRRSPEANKAIESEIQKLLKAGIIRPAKSRWSSPVHLVTKNGATRFCIDYRKLNSITKIDPHPLPRIDDITDGLSGSLVFSKLDFKRGFWQIKMSEESIPKTAFTVSNGQYEWLKLPFGLRNAPADFSRYMQIIFGALPFVKVYIDDIIIHSASLEEHLAHVRLVFDTLKKFNLKLNAEKCVWLASEIKVLGFIISGLKVRTDPEKISALVERKPPTNVRELQQLMGMLNYYRKFIQNFAHIAAPLYSLIKKDIKWHWTDEHQKAFQYFISILTSEPILRQPDLNRSFNIHTDASGIALGAILCQFDDDGHEYVVAYASRLLKGAETHYSITEKECLAVIWAIKNFRNYIELSEFTVVTDHSALQWLINVKDPTGRLARWAIALQTFRFNIVHRKGKKHGNVDALSRPVLVVLNESTTLRNQDPYEDSFLVQYLKHRTFEPGTAKSQIKRVTIMSNRYKMIDDIIYFKKTPDSDFVMYPPKAKRLEIIAKAHDMGHFQIQATINRLREKYYWKRMDDEVKKFIKTCPTCIRNQKSKQVEHPAQASYVTRLHQRVAIDCVFGMPQTAEGYVGILVITEYLSKYPWAVPIKSKSAEEIAEKLLDYVATFGPPEELLSDQGKEFLNEVVDAFTKQVGIQRRITSAYHPRTNGQVERLNQTIVDMLRKLGESDRHNWHKWLPFALLSYRSKVHTCTKFTPFELMFGRKMNSFENWNIANMITQDESIENRQNEIENMVSTHETAISNIESSKEHQMDNQNASANIEIDLIPIGTTVYVKSMGLLGKMEPRYHGPYTVVGYTRRKNYLLKNRLGLEI